MENIELLPEEVQPTTQELINQAQSRVLMCKAYLYETDYLDNKDRAGYNMDNYPDWEAKRMEAREAIDAEEAEVLRLREVLKQEAEQLSNEPI